jgi:DNA-binding MarR family transcriptional regulator
VDRLDAIAEAWRRERPDVDIAPLVLIGRLFRAVSLADSRLAAGLADFDLQPGWFDLLAALRRAGKPFQLNPTQLMDATMLSSAGMTKRLDRMAAAGLVERHPDPSDRRGTLVRLTLRGRRTIDAALPVHVANEAEVLAGLSDRERRSLDRLLRKLLVDLESPAHVDHYGSSASA